MKYIPLDAENVVNSIHFVKDIFIQYFKIKLFEFMILP